MKDQRNLFDILTSIFPKQTVTCAVWRSKEANGAIYKSLLEEMKTTFTNQHTQTNLFSLPRLAFVLWSRMALLACQPNHALASKRNNSFMQTCEKTHWTICVYICIYANATPADASHGHAERVPRDAWDTSASVPCAAGQNPALQKRCQWQHPAGFTKR